MPDCDPLSLWADDAVAKEMLITYLSAITDDADEDYIPPIDRIAVFDLDGTLFCETDPNCFDYTLLSIGCWKTRITGIRPAISNGKRPSKSCDRTIMACPSRAWRWTTANASPPPLRA